jgi:drug/metabolite transporter (DMT)-like permease
MALGLAVFSTAIAYLVFYRLIALWGATKTTSVTYLVPVFGMLWGWLFLREPVTLTMILGGLVIISGVMVLNSGKRVQAAAR